MLRLGLQMAEGMISGSNARVVGMLRAFQHFIRDFDAPPSKVLATQHDAPITHIPTPARCLVRACRPRPRPRPRPTTCVRTRIQVFARELDGALKLQIQYLLDCRPLSMAMGNGIKWIKNKVTLAPPHLPNAKVKEMLTEAIDTFITEKISIADQAIIANAIPRIGQGDVILVYSFS